MKYLISLSFLLSFPASADYYYLRIGIGKNLSINSSIPWEDQGEVGCMFGGGHVWEHNKKKNIIDLGLDHYSQCLAGPPIDNRKESSLDALYLKYERRFH